MNIPNEELSHFVQIASLAAREGGKILVQYWGKIADIRHKSSPSDLVTEADRASEEVVIAFLKKHFPSHSFLGEESGMHVSDTSEFLWVIDPLDGTTNYTHQFPMVSVSIGLVYQKEPIVGAIFNPFHDELFVGSLGQGAYLNGKKIAVSEVPILSESLLCTGFAYNRRTTPDNNYSEFVHMTQLCQGVRRMGSAALDLAYTAAGRLDGYWEQGIKPWDVAAGAIIVREAGGQVTDFDCGPLSIDSGRILATNGLIHKALSDELAISG